MKEKIYFWTVTNTFWIVIILKMGKCNISKFYYRYSSISMISISPPLCSWSLYHLCLSYERSCIHIFDQRCNNPGVWYDCMQIWVSVCVPCKWGPSWQYLMHQVVCLCGHSFLCGCSQLNACCVTDAKHSIHTIQIYMLVNGSFQIAIPKHRHPYRPNTAGDGPTVTHVLLIRTRYNSKHRHLIVNGYIGIERMCVWYKHCTDVSIHCCCIKTPLWRGVEEKKRAAFCAVNHCSVPFGSTCPPFFRFVWNRIFSGGGDALLSRCVGRDRLLGDLYR